MCPPYELQQDMVKVVAKRVLGERYPDFERLTKSFENAGINSRYSAVPFEWFEKPQNWPSRTDAYRFVSHPNYILVVFELIVVPMVLGLVWVAAVFTVLNAAMLALRISVEQQALHKLR